MMCSVALDAILRLNRMDIVNAVVSGCWMEHRRDWKCEFLNQNVLVVYRYGRRWSKTVLKETNLIPRTTGS